MEMDKLVNLKVKALRGEYPQDRRCKKGFGVRYILFSDKETYIEFENDHYGCSCWCSDLHVHTRKNKDEWTHIYNNHRIPDCDV